jgi:hypothetical protein
MKIRSVGAELFHAEAPTDVQVGRRDEVNTSFSQFCDLA